MPRITGNDQERIAKDRCLQAADMIPFFYSGVPGFAATSELQRTFTADQNYFLAGIAISMELNSQTAGGANITAYLAWTTSQQNVQNVNAGVNGSQSVLAALTLSNINNATVPFANHSNEYFNFQPYGFYVPQGKQLFLMAASLSAPTVRYSTILYMMPTFV